MSGSLYERKLTEETTSIDVIGQELLRNNNVVSLADGVQKAPGVYLLDNQISIRGGTGFTWCGKPCHGGTGTSPCSLLIAEM